MSISTAKVLHIKRSFLSHTCGVTHDEGLGLAEKIISPLVIEHWFRLSRYMYPSVRIIRGLNVCEYNARKSTGRYE